MSKEAGGIEPLAGPPLEAVGQPLRRSGSRRIALQLPSSELARSSDRRAGVRRESRCGVVGELAYRSPYYGTTPLRLGTLGGLMNVSYIFILLESWFLGGWRPETHSTESSRVQRYFFHEKKPKTKSKSRRVQQ